MNPMVNLNLMIEKELHLERQGQPRTRRWIGDANHIANDRWYQAKPNRASATRDQLSDPQYMVETQPRWQEPNPILARISSLFSFQPTNKKNPKTSMESA
jgi:hypothetical protein